MLYERLNGDDKAILLLVGSINCVRHKPFWQIGKMMQAGNAAMLCPSMSDFSSGRYLNQIEEAIIELAQERNTKHFVITCGCQWVILSTDGDLIKQRLKDNNDIDVDIWLDDHLEFGDHQ